MSRSCSPASLVLSFSLTSTLFATGCDPLKSAGDVSGDYVVDYESAWNIYEDGDFVARVEPGERTMVELSEGVLIFDVLCEEARYICPEEALWGEVEVNQPAGDSVGYIDIINRDPEIGEIGKKLPGYVQGDGSFDAIAGTDDRCGGAPAIGRVTGLFTDEGIEEGKVGWDYEEGCSVGGLRVDGPLRIEASFTAARLD